MIKVSVVGAKGRMGSHVVEAVNNAEDTQLALALDAGDDLTQITTDNTDVVVEFTVPSVSLNNVLTLIGQGVDVVVGTTGWTDEKLAQVKSAIANGPKPETQKVFIAPNFAISAVLADYFATKAAKYFESAEVIELHHPTKVDAPSGTAIHTAHGIAEARKAAGLAPVPDATETDGGSRGQVVDGIHVHAVRLRGLNAHEEVLFGNAGEQLTIRYRACAELSHLPDSIFFKLQSAERREKELHTAMVGPHREDLEILINGRDARLFASQGQQRTAMLAIKLGCAKIAQEATGEAPILLLDDVFSELDIGRRERLLSLTGENQVFITATDAAGVEGFAGVQFFRAEKHEITAVR